MSVCKFCDDALLEEHVINQMRYFDSGLGLLGEQGGEVIHAKFDFLL